MTISCHPCRLQTLGWPNGYRRVNGPEDHITLQIPLLKFQIAESGPPKGIGYQRCEHGIVIGDPSKQEIVWLVSATCPHYTPDHKDQAVKEQYTR